MANFDEFAKAFQTGNFGEKYVPCPSCGGLGKRDCKVCDTTGKETQKVTAKE